MHEGRRPKCKGGKKRECAAAGATGSLSPARLHRRHGRISWFPTWRGHLNIWPPPPCSLRKSPAPSSYQVDLDSNWLIDRMLTVTVCFYCVPANEREREKTSLEGVDTTNEDKQVSAMVGKDFISTTKVRN
ncbi:uncharacterized protein LOC144009753 isoform X1 [Festucalex cinctus]